MFAVIKTGGKQYKVAANTKLVIEKIEGAAGEMVVFPEVLMVDGTIGAPFVAGASVAAEIVAHVRGPKVISFKKRRRQNSKRKRGHRQDLTEVRIAEILTGGAKSAAKPAKKSEPKAEKAAEPKPGKASSSAPVTKDDISLIAGVGPAIEKKLRAAGINSFAQVAGWSAADVERIDGELELRGRATREEWVEQAKELIAGKPPRAKVDQDAAKKG